MSRFGPAMVVDREANESLSNNNLITVDIWGETITQLTFDDVLVFACLEMLGIMAIVGNLTLITVLIRFKHLTKASFVLILNMAIADVLHGCVTSFYLYPPIILKENHMPAIMIRIISAIDWTAWGMTITHMSAISIDRVIAVLMFAQYMRTMTAIRAKIFSLSCWSFFICMNMSFFAANFCCTIAPQASSDFYSFDFEKPHHPNGSIDHSVLNIYPPIYTPLEISTMIVLVITCPTTLINLWRRHQRKMAMRRASAMLLKMSQAVTSKAVDNVGGLEKAASKADSATAAASRQQQRIFIQIITVTVIFFLYMFVYYLFWYVVNVSAKMAVVLNSIFYSTSHMINPIVYFGLNEELRQQLRQILGIICPCLCKRESLTTNSSAMSLAAVRDRQMAARRKEAANKDTQDKQYRTHNGGAMHVTTTITEDSGVQITPNSSKSMLPTTGQAALHECDRQNSYNERLPLLVEDQQTNSTPTCPRFDLDNNTSSQLSHTISMQHIKHQKTFDRQRSQSMERPLWSLFSINNGYNPIPNGGESPLMKQSVSRNNNVGPMLPQVSDVKTVRNNSLYSTTNHICADLSQDFSESYQDPDLYSVNKLHLPRIECEKINEESEIWL